jgi:hypothetical protein
MMPMFGLPKQTREMSHQPTLQMIKAANKSRQTRPQRLLTTVSQAHRRTIEGERPNDVPL